MTYEFRLPDIGEGVAEGEIVQWFVEEGGSVKEDAPLVSVLTDKANVEIPSPKSGRIAKIHAKVGEKVKVGAVLVTIEEGGASAPTPKAPAKSAASAESAKAPAKSLASAPPSPPKSPEVQVAPTPSEGSGRVLATPYLRRLAAERGIDLTQVVGTGPGGRIQESDLASGGASKAATPSPPPPRPRTEGPSLRARPLPDPRRGPVRSSGCRSAGSDASSPSG